MDTGNKWCIICCLPFQIIGQSENEEKISKFCEEIVKDIGNGEKRTLNVSNFNEELLRLDKCFKLSVCLNCLTEMTELLASKQSMILLENHVISLQIKIVKGLRDLEKCMEKIKCHGENVKQILEGSDELSLKSKLGTEWSSNCLTLKLRQWILKDALIENKKLKGDLWISSEFDHRTGEQAKVKVEIEEPHANFDDDYVSNHSWDATDEIEEKLSIETNSKYISSKNRTVPDVKAQKTSTMTLRTRSSRQPNKEVEIAKPRSTPSTIKTKSKRKDMQKIKNIVKPVLNKTKSKERVHVPRVIRKCDLCPFNTRVEPAFEQHMRYHETEADPNSKSIECPHCPSKFSTQQFFKFHLKCHQGKYKLRCDICPKLIPVLSLADHLKSHFPPDDAGEEPPPKIIYCKNCSYCCTTRQAYLVHLLRHKSKTTSGIFTCDICSEEFSMPILLLNHYHEFHEGTLKKWPCDFPNCNAVLSTKNNLLKHKMGHSMEKKFNCSKCDMKFPTKARLEFHFQVHSGEKPFNCDLCDQRFRLKSYLLVHQRKEHDAAKLKCKFCEEEFYIWSTLKSHLRDVHQIGNVRFPCEICGRTYKFKGSLKTHLAVHEDDNNFTCEQCGKGFKTVEGLRLHMKVHGGEKNWKCEHCGKAFLRKENLRDHLRIHTGERPFVCEICGKDFNQVSALKTHKKNQHPN